LISQGVTPLGGVKQGWGGENKLFSSKCVDIWNKKAMLPQGNRAIPQVFFSVEVRQQHSLQV